MYLSSRAEERVSVFIVEMQVAEFISIQATFIPLTSWKWRHNLHTFRLCHGKIHFFSVRLSRIERNGNIPVLADVVEHAAYMNQLAHLHRGSYSDLAV